MERCAINLAEEKSDGVGEKEAVKAGQDNTVKEEEVTVEMKQLASQVFCGGKAEVFGILPEELWLKILEEQVDSAEDIRNVLRAFPQLDKLFQMKKASWLFPLVLPHLITKHLVAEEMEEGGWTSLRSEDLLKLRRVSKRWKNAVETSLENHSAHHPLMPRDNNAKVESNVVAITENHFSYHRLRTCPLGASRFEQGEEIDKFLQEMGDFQGNPFPGKSVLLQVFDDDDNPQDTNFRKAVARTVVLFERFGQHVVDLIIDHLADEENDVGDLELHRNILKCLTLVPNLRSLILSGDFFGNRDPERDNFFGDPESQNLFPELRNLERFEWRVTSSRYGSMWVEHMVSTYACPGGLRKLGIPLNLLSRMDLALFQSINLTELHLFLYDDDDPIVDLIERVLKALPNHQEIRKFGLSSFDTPFGLRAVGINELIRMLAEFKFESVVFQDLDWVEGLLISEPAVNPPITVTSLDLEEDGELSLSYDFLTELPNLKFLSVKIGRRGRRQVLEEYRKMQRDGEVVDWEVRSFGLKLRRYFMKAYDPTLEIPENEGIWEGIPSLEMLSLSMPVMLEEEEGLKYLGLRFVKECGNKAFFGPRPDVVKWDEEKVKDVEAVTVQTFERGIGLMVNDFDGW